MIGRCVYVTVVKRGKVRNEPKREDCGENVRILILNQKCARVC